MEVQELMKRLSQLPEDIPITTYTRPPKMLQFWVCFGSSYVELVEYTENKNKYKSCGKPRFVFIETDETEGE